MYRPSVMPAAATRGVVLAPDPAPNLVSDRTACTGPGRTTLTPYLETWRRLR